MKIALMTEGTYPFAFGGVSVWCDQLIRGMPGYDFHVVALVGTAAEPAVWALPGNVVSLVKMPLWGPAAVPTSGRCGGGRRGGGRGGGLPLRLLRQLIETLLDSPAGTPQRFAVVLRELHEYCSRHGTLSTSLASDKAVHLLAGAWRDRWTDAGRPAPTLHDAVTALQLLDHSLRPLCYPPVPADLGHAVANGLSLLPALAAKWQHGVPVLLTEHGVYLREQFLQHRRSPYRWPVKALYLRFLRHLCATGYQEAAAITPGNAYNRRWEERLGAEPSRIRTVYNGVDPACFPALDGEPAVPTISWVGRIDPIKDLETLLRAFSLVRKELPAARLRLFGSAPQGGESYLQRCQALAAELEHRRHRDVRGPGREHPRRLPGRQHRCALQRLRGLPLQPDRGDDLRPGLRRDGRRRRHRGVRRHRAGGAPAQPGADGTGLPHPATGRRSAAPARRRRPRPRTGELHRRRGHQHLRRDLPLPRLGAAAADSPGSTWADAR